MQPIELLCFNHVLKAYNEDCTSRKHQGTKNITILIQDRACLCMFLTGMVKI